MKAGKSWLASALIVSGIAIVSCSSTKQSLSVDLRTDLVPKREFASVSVQVDGAAATAHPVSEGIDAYLAGTRVADFGDLGEGSVLVKVTLIDDAGDTLVSRLSRVTLSGDYALTVVVTRNCGGVKCPVADGDPALTTCLAGKCVRPECTPDTPDQCNPAECKVAADCRTDKACLTTACDHGVCLFTPHDEKCGAGETCNPDLGCTNPEAANTSCVPTGKTETVCTDGVDDDCDGRIDCMDDDCSGSVCEDGDACTKGESCKNNTCSGGTQINCDDNNECTTDSCNPTGGCEHKPSSGGSCDDKNSCTGPGTCAEGVCQAGPQNCDDGNPCTDDTCGPDGCLHTNNTAACDDGLFCNGADTCAAGACTVHAGTPCGQACNEDAKVCVGCVKNEDCGPATVGAFGACGGFVGTCGNDGTQSRTVTTRTCNNNVCSANTTTETQACSRNITVSCGTTTFGNWSGCGGFATACDEVGSRFRTRTTYNCGGGTCNPTTTTDSESCSRNVSNGTGCGGSKYCCNGSCKSPSDGNNCGSCGISCASKGETCRQIAGGAGYTCSCGSVRSNDACVAMGFGPNASCWLASIGGTNNCQCQCASTGNCGGQCRGGGTCTDKSQDNYCHY